MQDTHSHGHDHGHDHDHDADDAHAPVAKDEKINTYHQFLGLAMKELLIEKGVITADEIRQAIEERDGLTPALGAKVVARAWVDQAYKARLLENGVSAVREVGIESGSIHLVVVENTPKVHNVVVCTLCSCYPRAIIGLPPSWYKSVEYRSRVVRDPRSVLREFGTELPGDVDIHVRNSTADIRYLVLPMRPAGTQGMTEKQLAALVTRDCMIGVTLPKSHP